jgi:hypothetical protein
MFRRISGFHLWAARATGWIGLICLILGIIGGAMDEELGLEATYWLILAPALWLAGILNILLGLEESIKE